MRFFPGGVRTPVVEAVLNDTTSSPASEAFRRYDADGDIADPSDVGDYVAAVAHDVSRDVLVQKETWDYGAD